MAGEVVYEVKFEKNYQAGRFLLVELDDHLVDELGLNLGEDDLFHSESRVWIRGEKEEEAAICTKNKTYVVRAADISNTLLLVGNRESVPKDEGEQVENCPMDADEPENTQKTLPLFIKDSISSYLELSLVPAKMDKVRFLLAKNPYSGPESEVKRATYYDFDGLRNVIQGSDEEIRK